MSGNPKVWRIMKNESVLTKERLHFIIVICDIKHGQAVFALPDWLVVSVILYGSVSPTRSAMCLFEGLHERC